MGDFSKTFEVEFSGDLFGDTAAEFLIKMNNMHLVTPSDQFNLSWSIEHGVQRN